MANNKTEETGNKTPVSYNQDQLDAAVKKALANTFTQAQVDEAVKEALANTFTQEQVDEAVKEALANTAADNTPETIEALTTKLESLKVAEAEAKKQAEAKAKAKALENDKRPVFKHANGTQWRFKTNAPETLNVDGTFKKLEDIVEDKNLMLELVTGANNFVEQIN